MVGRRFGLSDGCGAPAGRRRSRFQHASYLSVSSAAATPAAGRGDNRTFSSWYLSLTTAVLYIPTLSRDDATPFLHYPGTNIGGVAIAFLTGHAWRQEGHYSRHVSCARVTSWHAFLPSATHLPVPSLFMALFGTCRCWFLLCLYIALWFRFFYCLYSLGLLPPP